MLIYNHFMIVSYFKTTNKIIYFFTLFIMTNFEYS